MIGLHATHTLAYAEKIYEGGSFNGICICCAFFATSAFDVIFMFPNQRLGEVKYEQSSAAGLSNTQPSLQDRILLNYAVTDNAHEVRKKTFVFCDV